MVAFDEKKNDNYYPARVSPHGLTAEKKRRAKYLLVALLGVVALIWMIGNFSHPKHKRPVWWISEDDRNRTFIPRAAFQPPEDVDYRRADSIDAFANYKYRSTCPINSLDLHSPFSPLCQSRQDMLNAMSWGGRIGFDAPYMPRGCDMRWFSTEEVCEIMGRFSKVIIVGDSMMRHIIGGLNVFMRADLGYGAVTDWNFNSDERQQCRCNTQFNVKACSLQGIFKTEDVVTNDPASFKCDREKVNVVIEVIVRHPIPADEVQRWKESVGSKKPDRPIAFVYGHGLWNDLDLATHIRWLETLQSATLSQLPFLGEEGQLWPQLVVTPNAAGVLKPDEWLVSQGNKALAAYEEAVKVEDARRGVEHLGTYNMSLAANSYDGGHLDLKGNLVKAMMVMNWLNMIDVSQW